FELAREVGALAILDQRRGPHDAQWRLLALPSPGSKQRRKNLRRDGALIEGKPDLDRDAARVREIGFVILPQQVLDPEMLHLLPVGIRGEREAARCWQARLHQAGEIRRFGPDPLGVGSGRIIEGEHEGGDLAVSVTLRRERSEPRRVAAYMGSSSLEAAFGGHPRMTTRSYHRTWSP